MSLPSQAEYVIAGAGIHGLSTAWRLAERLTAAVSYTHLRAHET